jgi:hypothetical protein
MLKVDEVVVTLQRSTREVLRLVVGTERYKVKVVEKDSVRNVEL